MSPVRPHEVRESTLENADWLRSRTWDLPDDVDGFLSAIMVPGMDFETPREAVARFMRLPAAARMPRSLRRALRRRRLLPGLVRTGIRRIRARGS